MAITATVATQNSTSTDATNYNTASLTAAANKLYLLVVAHGNTGGATATPTATGGGLGTWVVVESNQQGTGNQRITVLRAMSASPGAAAAVNIDFAGATQHNCLWKIIEIDGVKTTGTQGADAIAESVQGDDSGTTNQVSLAGVTAGNATFGCMTQNASTTTSAGTNFALLGDTPSSSSPSIQLTVVWSVTGQNPIDIPSTGTPITALIGIELEAQTGTAHALAGVTAGVSTMGQAALPVAKTFSGVAAGVSTATGSMIEALALAGVSAGVSTATAAIIKAVSLSGAAAGVSTGTGTLLFIHGLSGVAAGSSSVTGDLSKLTGLAGVIACQFSVSGNLTVLERVYLFQPPTSFRGAQISNEPSARPVGQTMDDWKLARRLFRHYGPREVGLSVLKVNGEYITVESPSQDLIAVATEVYLGGHQYTVPAVVAAALMSAGYEVE